MTDRTIKVGVTLGDVNGIGPEVAIGTFLDPRMSELCTPVFYGSAKALGFYKKTVEGAENFQYSNVPSAREAKPRRVNLVNCMSEELRIEPGQQTREAGKAAVDALRTAVADLKNGDIDVLVTCPINKENVHGENFNFTGHTEFLAAELGGEPLMMMCSGLLKVGLATIHIPVSEVSGHLTKDGIAATLGRLRHSLITDFGVVEPRLAVLALNPHAGDGGLLGNEEQAVIKPAIDAALAQGVLAFGPFPADGFFAAATYRKYDAVLAMYHDQGLVPFKTLTPEGVNFTAGLSKVRTSPDHGVAYDIAGRGEADPSSMREAVYMALDIFRNRGRWEEMSKNPLPRYEREHSKKDLSVKDLLPETEAED